MRLIPKPKRKTRHFPKKSAVPPKAGMTSSHTPQASGRKSPRSAPPRNRYEPHQEKSEHPLIVRKSEGMSCPVRSIIWYCCISDIASIRLHGDVRGEDDMGTNPPRPPLTAFLPIHKAKKAQGVFAPKGRRVSHPEKFFEKNNGHSMLNVIHCISNVEIWTKKNKGANERSQQKTREESPVIGLGAKKLRETPPPGGIAIGEGKGLTATRGKARPRNSSRL